MRKLAVSLGIFTLLVSIANLPATAVLHNPASEAFEVKFETEQFSPQFDPAVQVDLGSSSPAWQSYASSLRPDWRTYHWDKLLEMPRFAAGSPVSVVSASSLADEAYVVERLQGFLEGAEGVLRVPASDLEFDSYGTYRNNERAWALYQQHYQGLPVFYAYLGLHIYEGGVNAISAEIFPGIGIDAEPYLGEHQAAELAKTGLPWNEETDSIGEITLGVLPKVETDNITYFLAYQVMVNTSEPAGQWRTFVDAFTGEIHWRLNEVHSYTIDGHSDGDVQERLAYDPYTLLPSRYQYTIADGNQTYSDANGDFSIEVGGTQQYTVTGYNRGQYVRVYKDGAVAEDTDMASSTDPAVIYWDDSNTSPAERDCYYHTNVVHDWLKTTDPDWTTMDNPISCTVDVTSGTCNAYYNGAMYFYAAGGGCVNFGQVADIVYHEYHHGVTRFTYLNNPPNSSGMNEGYSDYASMAITNDPCTAKGYQTSYPDGCMRNGTNVRQYPASECNGEVHCLGEVCMGATWKMRKALVDKYGEQYALAADILFREAIVQRPYNLPALATKYLLANDNNGTIYDGTPDYWQLYDAFDAHDIPVPAISIMINIDHTPLDDQPDVSSPLLISAVLTPTATAGTVIEDSTKIHYTTDGLAWQIAPMANVGGDTYEGYIQPSAGKLVDYYLRSVTTEDITTTDPIRAADGHMHQFLTGDPTLLLDDDLESDLGWTVGAPDDDATVGFWERTDPEYKEYNGDVVQPDDDHTPTGINCFVTDGRGGYWQNYDVDAGKTSLLSPQYEFGPGMGGFVEFYSFLATITVPDDTLSVHLSGDGENWVQVWEIHGDGYNDPNYIHQKVYFRSEDLGSPELLQVRFEIEDSENNTTTEAAVDDIVIKIGADWADAPDVPGSSLAFRAAPASPSVFSQSTAIRFAIPARDEVALRIFDVSGRTVRTLIDGALDAGSYQTSWDGRTDGGEAAPAGLYYYKLASGIDEATFKMLLVR